MPSQAAKLEAFLDYLAGIAQDAGVWSIDPANTYYGRPRLENPNLPLCVLDIQGVAEEPSGARGTRQLFSVTVIGLFDLPADNNENILLYLAGKRDLFVAEFESLTVWPGGGVNGYVKNTQYEREDQEGNCAVVIDIEVEYHCEFGD